MIRDLRIELSLGLRFSVLTVRVSVRVLGLDWQLKVKNRLHI